MMSCEDSYWLLSQTFPEMIGGVTRHSARDLYSELPPAPEEKVLVSCYINPVWDDINLGDGVGLRWREKFSHRVYYEVYMFV